MMLMLMARFPQLAIRLPDRPLPRTLARSGLTSGALAQRARLLLGARMPLQTCRLWG